MSFSVNFVAQNLDSLTWQSQKTAGTKVQPDDVCLQVFKKIHLHDFNSLETLIDDIAKPQKGDSSRVVATAILHSRVFDFLSPSKQWTVIRHANNKFRGIWSFAVANLGNIFRPFAWNEQEKLRVSHAFDTKRHSILWGAWVFTSTAVEHIFHVLTGGKQKKSILTEVLETNSPMPNTVLPKTPPKEPLEINTIEQQAKTPELDLQKLQELEKAIIEKGRPGTPFLQKTYVQSEQQAQSTTETWELIKKNAPKVAERIREAVLLLYPDSLQNLTFRGGPLGKLLELLQENPRAARSIYKEFYTYFEEAFQTNPVIRDLVTEKAPNLKEVIDQDVIPSGKK